MGAEYDLLMLHNDEMIKPDHVWFDPWLIVIKMETNMFQGLWSFFLPSWNEITLQIKLGAIGKPKFMTFMHSKTCYQQREKFYSRGLAGGMLTSIGEYPLAFAYMIFKGQSPIKITATGVNFDTGVDKSHSVTILFEEGDILTSFISCGEHIIHSITLELFVSRLNLFTGVCHMQHEVMAAKGGFTTKQL